MKAIRTFIIIANDGEARFLENSGVGRGVQELAVFDHVEGPGYADFSGRSQGGPGVARHGFERTTSEEEVARRDFAKFLLKEAAGRWKEGYDRLLVAAPPKMLGVLRDNLDGPMAAGLSGDLDKDLTKIAVADLPEHFADLAAL